MPSHTILSYALLATYVCAVGATDYTVGGDSFRWSIGTNYMAWASNYNFTVGDALIFNYVQRQHDVYEVTEDSFRSCDSTNGTLHIYNSGNDIVNLTEAKEYWFLCNIKDHCKGGMKFAVNVSEVPTPPPVQTPPVVALPPPPPNSAVREGIKLSYCSFFVVIISLWYAP